AHGKLGGLLPGENEQTFRQTGRMIFSLGPEAIPALVRGLNASYALRAACPMGSLQARLIQVVPHCNDVALLDYLLLNLGTSVPPATRVQMAKSFPVQQVRDAAAQRKAQLILFVISEERRR